MPVTVLGMVLANVMQAVDPPKMVAVRSTAASPLNPSALYAAWDTAALSSVGAPRVRFGAVPRPGAQVQVQAAALLVPQDHEVAGLAVGPRVAVGDELSLGGRVVGTAGRSRVLHELVGDEAAAAVGVALPREVQPVVVVRGVPLGVEPGPAQVDLGVRVREVRASARRRCG